jgi:hypothetical protein
METIVQIQPSSLPSSKILIFKNTKIEEKMFLFIFVDFDNFPLHILLCYAKK